jgi:hypothetical protein
MHIAPRRRLPGKTGCQLPSFPVAATALAVALLRSSSLFSAV